VDAKFIGEVTVADYGKLRELSLRPDDKVASLADLSTSYTVDDNTGQPRLTRLSTHMRDQVLSLRAGAVEDLGSVELHGQSVRLLQSRGNECVIHVWIDPLTDLPIQISIQEPTQHWIYTSIKIDEELDDDLFSLEVPDGYSLFRGGLYKPWPDRIGKIYAKMRHLHMACIVFAEKHDGQFPKELANLDIEDEILDTLLAAPDRPDGPAVIQYRQPRPDTDWSTEVMLYEAYDQWPDGGIAVGFADGHCEVISEQKRFEELVR
jgi:hypothetical protein